MKPERVPDWVFNDVCQITSKWLKEQNIKGVLADLDNTLTIHGHSAPKRKVSEWMRGIQKDGIPLVIISNNNEKRVRRFCEPFALKFVSKSRKPRPSSLLGAANELGLQPCEMAMVGDQIFTDVTAAKRAGMLAIIVRPLSKNIFFTARRLVEYRYIRHAVKKRRYANERVSGEIRSGRKQRKL